MGGVSGEHGVAGKTAIEEIGPRRLSEAYQSRGVGAVNAEQSDRGADILGRGGIGAQAVEGRAGHGELLGGTQAGAGDTSGHHRGSGGENLEGRGRELRWGEIRVREGFVQVELRSDFFPGHVVH